MYFQNNVTDFKVNFNLDMVGISRLVRIAWGQYPPTPTMSQYMVEICIHIVCICLWLENLGS